MTNPPEIGSPEDVKVRCRKCKDAFHPDMKTKGPWTCPECGKKNTNLRRQYRSIADYFILLCFGVIVVGLAAKYGEGSVGDVPAMDAKFLMTSAIMLALLVSAIVKIYTTNAPWLSKSVNILIATVFSGAFILNILLPLVLFGMVNLPYLIVYGVIFLFVCFIYIRARQMSL